MPAQCISRFLRRQAYYACYFMNIIKISFKCFYWFIEVIDRYYSHFILFVCLIYFLLFQTYGYELPLISICLKSLATTHLLRKRFFMFPLHLNHISIETNQYSRYFHNAFSCPIFCPVFPFQPHQNSPLSLFL